MNLWEDRVTVYRMGDHGLERKELKGCYYSYTEKQVGYERYQRHQCQSLLIVPGDGKLQIGDRVYPGIGPERVDWERFLPVLVPGLCQLDWVRPVRALGKIHHTEAGG